MYYDYTKVLTYPSLLNFLIGERGCGKTYGITKHVINKFIKKGEQFAYIRRYKSELKKAVPTFFDAVSSEFNNQEFKSKGNTFYINNEIAGHAMTLSTAQDLKSSNFSKVTTIIFDEFIIEEGQKKFYLNDEVLIFLNLLETIMRTRENVKIFLLGNSANIYTNPYFLYFNIQVPYNNDIKLYKDNLILVQYMNNEDYRNKKKQTKFGKLVAGSSFEQYAIENKCLNDDNNFIEKKKGTSKFNFAFIYKNQTLGVWNDFKEGKMYVSYDYIKNTPYMFSCTLKDHTPNTLLINSAKTYSCWKNFISNYKLGNVRFENNKIKFISNEVLKLFI